MTSGGGWPVWQGTFLPFGEEYNPQISSNHYKFTGKERDSESGLDYLGARYYANSLGRFSSIDPIHFQASTLNDPQKFNLYAYVRNSPLRLIDPDGKAARLPDDEQKRKKALEGMKAAVGKQAGEYLYDNKVVHTDANGNTTTEHYVGIYTKGPDGKGPLFDSINQNAAEIGSLINSREVVEVTTVASGTVVTNDQGQSMVIGPGQSHLKTELTGRTALRLKCN